MRIFVVVILAVLLGLSIGAAVSVAEFGPGLLSPPGTAGRPTLSNTGLRSIPGPPAKAVVDELVYNFGEMDQNTEGRHVFKVRNEGSGVLVVKAGQTSC